MKKTHYETKILSRNRNSTESGRSMVEMLGVLAIIGVISIGAISGYTYGMNRYRTNEILDGGTTRAYTVATQLSMGLEPNLSEFKDVDATAGGIFGDTGSIKQWDGEFGLAVNGVTQPVCENLIRMTSDTAPLRAIAKDASGTDILSGECAKTNDLYLVYNIDSVSGSAFGGEDIRSSAGAGYIPEITSTAGSASGGEDVSTSQISISGAGAVPVSEPVSAGGGYTPETTTAEPISSECVGKADGTLCDSGDAEYWGTCQSNECVPCQPNKCTWTEWMDVSYPHPGADGGDFETYTKIRAAGGTICEQPQEIECRAEPLPDTPLTDLRQVVLCNVEVGLVCRNQDQSGQMCFNYQIRVLCCDQNQCTPK